TPFLLGISQRRLRICSPGLGAWDSCQAFLGAENQPLPPEIGAKRGRLSATREVAVKSCVRVCFSPSEDQIMRPDQIDADQIDADQALLSPSGRPCPLPDPLADVRRAVARARNLHTVPEALLDLPGMAACLADTIIVRLAK